MSENTPAEQRAAKTDQWRERVAEQQHSGLTVRQFCKERGLPEHCFYAWRKRLKKRDPVRFALVDRGAAELRAAEASLELLLSSGERLRIGAGVDAATLRTVLDVLRA